VVAVDVVADGLSLEFETIVCKKTNAPAVYVAPAQLKPPKTSPEKGVETLVVVPVRVVPVSVVPI
jgi:hypothetical protein